ncbi:MAG: hypothetical protein ACLRYE_00760 [Gemmiger formicilis]|uniref:hypothetical protein n=1 Tax=Gemmiger formicilis TaxID=745368 RepID=UPI00399FA5D0
MIETTVLNFLSGKLRVPVLAEVPRSPRQLCRGGKDRRRTQHRPEAGHCGRCRATADALQAARLDDDVVEAMAELATLTGVGACRLVRDYNFTDTANRRYRYQAVFEIVYY